MTDNLIADEASRVTADLLAAIHANREEYVRAWLAEHDGLLPSQCMIVEQVGVPTTRLWVERRPDPSTATRRNITPLSADMRDYVQELERGAGDAIQVRASRDHLAVEVERLKAVAGNAEALVHGLRDVEAAKARFRACVAAVWARGDGHEAEADELVPAVLAPLLQAVPPPGPLPTICPTCRVCRDCGEIACQCRPPDTRTAAERSQEIAQAIKAGTIQSEDPVWSRWREGTCWTCCLCGHDIQKLGTRLLCSACDAEHAVLLSPQRALPLKDAE